jgi:hypothetical protein
MTFNLKNRPNYDTASKIVTLDTGICVTYYGKEEVDAWFEGFEKQETKRLSDARVDLEKAKGSDARHCGFLAGYITAKKEILGET